MQDLPKTSIFDNTLSIKGTSSEDYMVEFKHWSSTIGSDSLPHTSVPKPIKYYEVTVPTKDTARFGHLVKTMLL